MTFKKYIVLSLCLLFCFLGVQEDSQKAHGWGILPAMVGGGGSQYDGYYDLANNWFLGMDGDGLGDNAIAVGVLTGANLVATQHGNIPASTGSPATRSLTATSTQYFTHTLTAGGIIAPNGGAGWTLIIKGKDFANSASDQALYWYTLNDAGRLRVLVKKDTNHKLSVQIYDVDAIAYKLSAVTTDVIPATGDLYIYVWYDGTVFRAGFSATRCTKWSNFEANKRLTNTATSTATGPAAGIGANQVGGDPCTVKLYYVDLSKTCLINNAS